jgi:hypothetical protein
MRFIPHNTAIIFLGTSGVGSNYGQIAPQLRFFDVYYTTPPVVGFHAVGSYTPAQVLCLIGEES